MVIYFIVHFSSYILGVNVYVFIPMVLFYEYKLLKNLCPFIAMVLSYSYEFLNMGISKILK